MLTPLNSRQISMIVANVRKVVLTRNIAYLTKQSYNFLYLSSGFIAHYNLYGFRDEYRNTKELEQDILRFREMNQWSNFRPGDRDYEYNMAKKACYNAVCEMIEGLI